MEGNETTWTGNIGLMYPSTYGYAADSTYWDTVMNAYSITAYKYDWLNVGSSGYRCTISPSAKSSNNVLFVSSDRGVDNGSVNLFITFALSLVLYLKSDVIIS